MHVNTYGLAIDTKMHAAQSEKAEGETASTAEGDRALAMDIEQTQDLQHENLDHVSDSEDEEGISSIQTVSLVQALAQLLSKHVIF